MIGTVCLGDELRYLVVRTSAHPVLVYIGEVHVRYYIWREAPRLYKSHMFLGKKFVAGTVEIEV